MAAVVAFLDDIFFQAKMMETAKQLGVELRTCANPSAFELELAQNAPRLIIVDLNARADAFSAIALAKSAAAGVPLIAFLSHVQTELADRARAAGCADVMPRSKFTRDLATILGAAKSHS